MKVEIKLDMQAIKKIEDAARAAAHEALEAAYSDLVGSKTMPFDTGNMQNNQTFTTVEGEDTINGEDIYTVSLVTGSPQARRLYYHPEYNFQKGKNENAGAKWLEPYISGEKKELVPDEFAKAFKRRLGQ